VSPHRTLGWTSYPLTNHGIRALNYLCGDFLCYNYYMPYNIGDKGSYGCSGYPVVKEGTTDIMGCHDTREAAGNQIAAIEANENKSYDENAIWETVSPSKEEPGLKNMGTGIRQPDPMASGPSAIKKPKKKRRRSIGGAGGSSAGAVATTGGGTGMGTKMDDEENYDQSNRVVSKEAGIKEGDFVMGMTSEGMAHGVVEHIMWEGGTLGTPGSEYALESMPPENPAMSVRVYEYEEEEDEWEATAYSIGMMYVNATVVDMEDHDMEDEDMEYMSKAETYSPNEGMKAAARRALKWKEDGKATGAGTAVGWGRATDIAAGRSMSLSVVRRMFSFFSRHEEASKGGKDFNNTSNPSNGRIMWDAWGGNAGFAWSRAIVNRMRDKALFADFGKDYTKVERMVVKAIGVGSMVSWNSSGGRARGKITRIIRNGSYNVPGTSVTVTGTPEDPAAVIRLYRDGEPTDTIVAHKIKTLRSA
jgi:hypothetical protein